MTERASETDRRRRPDNSTAGRRGEHSSGTGRQRRRAYRWQLIVSAGLPLAERWTAARAPRERICRDVRSPRRHARRAVRRRLPPRARIRAAEAPTYYSLKEIKNCRLGNGPSATPRTRTKGLRDRLRGGAVCGYARNRRWTFAALDAARAAALRRCPARRRRVDGLLGVPFRPFRWDRRGRRRIRRRFRS